MKIVIEIIPHNEQRYETLGDYFIDEFGDWQIRISKMENLNYEIAIALHELHELSLCQKEGIKNNDIDSFDIAFEDLRKQKPDIIGLMEPGDMKSAPYYHQHQTATEIEKIHIKASGENWDKYEEVCNSI